jgi:hypothetical protein
MMFPENVADVGAEKEYFSVKNTCCQRISCAHFCAITKNWVFLIVTAFLVELAIVLIAWFKKNQTALNAIRKAPPLK